MEVNKRLKSIARTQTFKYSDIVIDSNEIKKVILHRMKELNVRPHVLCKVANVSYSVFKKYLNNDKTLSTPNLRQEHLITMMELLGIKLRMQVILGKFEDVDRSIFENAYKDYESR